MMLFIAIYFYFLIQLIMATKWNDSVLTMDEIKDKLSWVPSMVEEKTKNVKKRISDKSVIVKGKVKDLTQKAGKTFKDWKSYVLDKCKTLKTKLGDIQIMPEEDTKDTTDSCESPVMELVKTNKELVKLTRELIDKYDETLKVLNEISKSISSSKIKTKSEKK